jgi:GT2 family glycosyltransferase
MAVSRAAIETAGMLEGMLFLYLEDVEWSLRIRNAGFEVRFVPDAVARHRVSASSGGEVASTAYIYYGTRNTLVVAERLVPMRAPARALRRAVVYGTWLAHALTKPNRGAAVAAVREGYRDAVAGRLGPRSRTRS